MEELSPALGNRRRDLVHLLHRVQAEHGFIPAEEVTRIAERLKITESEVYGVLTFYRAFRLKPHGGHLITVCAGTSCHVREGHEVLREVERLLGVGPGETTADRVFSLETVNCLGCCAIGPTVVIDGRYHAHVSLREIAGLLAEARNSG
jgi:NADH-quinone oxidoreductase subunit E